MRIDKVVFYLDQFRDIWNTQYPIHGDFIIIFYYML